MKKFFVAILIVCLILSSFSGCSTNSTNNSSDTLKQLGNEDISSLSETDVQLNRFNGYFGNIKKYDKWLESMLASDAHSTLEVYLEYLSFLAYELEITVEHGKAVLDVETQYNSWKECLERWVDSIHEIMIIEMNSTNSDPMGQLVLLISRCNLFRQKVIQSKIFLYRYEFYYKSASDNRKIILEDPDIACLLEYDVFLLADENKYTVNSVFDSETIELLNYFNNNVNEYQAGYDELINKELDENGHNDFGVYLEYLNFWEDLEYKYSISARNDLLEDFNEYEQWKNAADQLKGSSQSLFTCEKSILIGDYFNTYNLQYNFFCQQVLCQKFFLCYKNYQQIVIQGGDIHEIAIKWGIK